MLPFAKQTQYPRVRKYLQSKAQMAEFLQRQHIQAIENILQKGSSHTYGDGSLSDAEFMDYGTDRTKLQKAPYSLLLFPANTKEVSDVIRYCAKHKLSVVPSGGRTGLCGGAVAGPFEIVLSLKKMDRFINFDPYLPSMHVQAGMITAQIQDLADEKDLFFPLDLASSGSSHIGGNIASNAGGTRFIRYGSLRNWILGLTIVTGTGDILRFPGRVLKDNTGFDLKNLFIGQEGSLGIITETILRLVPKPQKIQTALLALSNLSMCVKLLKNLQKKNHTLLAFEYWDSPSMKIVRDHLSLTNPFEKKHEAYCLLEWEGNNEKDDIIYSCFEELQNHAHIPIEILLAKSTSQANTFWKYREGISESLSTNSNLHKQDISLPIKHLTRFTNWLRAIIHNQFKSINATFFGHIGDGNLHINFFSKQKKTLPIFFHDECQKLDEIVYKKVTSLQGSISAEHGIGILKKNFFSYGKDPVVILLMNSIKKILDPNGILNSGKIF